MRILAAYEAWSTTHSAPRPPPGSPGPFPLWSYGASERRGCQALGPGEREVVKRVSGILEYISNTTS